MDFSNELKETLKKHKELSLDDIEVRKNKILILLDGMSFSHKQLS